MGRDHYLSGMEQRLRDLSLQIESVRTRLMDSPDHGLKAELANQLEMLERRRDIVREKLEALADEPETTGEDPVWEDMKAEFEEDWDALVRDFEERVASLA